MTETAESMVTIWQWDDGKRWPVTYKVVRFHGGEEGMATRQGPSIPPPPGVTQPTPDLFPGNKP